MLIIPKDCTGVVHVGANDGRERTTYAALHLPVLWIEALPAAYNRLLAHLVEYPLQEAVCALVTDTEGQKQIFHVSSNEGRSSSIFELGQHKDTWPDVSYVDSIQLVSTTLERILSLHVVPHNTLVLDAQGAELLILRGAGERLRQFRHVHLEVADYQAYVGGCLLDEVANWMTEHGYTEMGRETFGRHPGGAGVYYNMAFTSCAAY